MHDPGGSREEAVIQCMIQVVIGRSRCTMHETGGNREEAVVQCMIQVVIGKKPLYNAWSRW